MTSSLEETSNDIASEMTDRAKAAMPFGSSSAPSADGSFGEDAPSLPSAMPSSDNAGPIDATRRPRRAPPALRRDRAKPSLTSLSRRTRTHFSDHSISSSSCAATAASASTNVRLNRSIVLLSASEAPLIARGVLRNASGAHHCSGCAPAPSIGATTGVRPQAPREVSTTMLANPSILS